MQQPDYKDGEKVIAMVGKALTAITARLQSLGQFDGTESKVKIFVSCNLYKKLGYYYIQKFNSFFSINIFCYLGWNFGCGRLQS